MKTILVIYHTQQKGNTGKCAELVAQGCRQVAGVQVKLIDVNKARVDMDELVAAAGVALGTPDYFTYMAGGLKQFFDDALLASYGGAKTLGKPYVAFVTHGGGGGAVDSVVKLAGALKYTSAAPPLVCKGAPAGEAVQQAVALGKALAEAVAAKKQAAR
jgi:multimeric flavodoxin WrbA